VNSKMGILQSDRRVSRLPGREGLDRIPNSVKRVQTNRNRTLAECVSVCHVSYFFREGSGSREESRN